jgi:hypothetical protein
MSFDSEGALDYSSSFLRILLRLATSVWTAFLPFLVTATAMAEPTTTMATIGRIWRIVS